MEDQPLEAIEEKVEEQDTLLNKVEPMEEPMTELEEQISLQLPKKDPIDGKIERCLMLPETATKMKVPTEPKGSD